jgi:hypothetical protein
MTQSKSWPEVKAMREEMMIVGDDICMFCECEDIRCQCFYEDLTQYDDKGQVPAWIWKL